MKLIPVPGRRVAKVGLLACVLAATTLYALTASATAANPPTSARNIAQRPIGTATMSKKTFVNLGDLAAAGGGRASGARGVAHVGVPAVTAVRPGSNPAPQLTAAAQFNAAAGVAPTIDKSFDGLHQINDIDPPDPNAAAGLTQIVEVVNVRMAVYTRSGALDSCGVMDLRAFLGSPAGEVITDPRVIYDNVANKFTVIATVAMQAPPGPGPHLPGFPIIRIAHSLTGNACGAWSKYYLSSTALNGNDIADGAFIDQPSIGQDRNAFLFSGIASNATRNGVDKFFAFAEPKSCAYSTDVPGGCSLPIFTTTGVPGTPGHYATPASAGGTPMISTGAAYFVASVPNVGYQLYRMDNAANPAQTTLVLQATVGLAADVQQIGRLPGQPGAPWTINLGAILTDADIRIKSTPTFDGTRIWFTHTTWAANHPVVRYGAINVSNNTETDALAVHSSSSDDFLSSIAVAVNGTSRTIFLNWSYTDVDAGIPVTDTAAAITISSSTDPLPPINFGGDIKLTDGGISNNDRFGDYSSTMIDPVNAGQVCAVTAQEYFDKSAIWDTRISRFGAPGC